MSEFKKCPDCGKDSSILLLCEDCDRMVCPWCMKDCRCKKCQRGEDNDSSRIHKKDI